MKKPKNSQTEPSKPARYARNILAFLNIILAIIILVTAYKLIETDFGRYLLALGYLLLTICVILKVKQEW